MTRSTHASKILLSAFRGTSAEALLKHAGHNSSLLLPNDKIKDSELLIDAVFAEKPNYIVSFGQKPNIINKVHIETTARDGELFLNTNFDCDRLKCLLERNGVDAKISHNAGTSYCNALYLNGMRHIFKNGIDSRMVFIHIPFLKNISDMDSFRKRILKAVGEFCM